MKKQELPDSTAPTPSQPKAPKGIPCSRCGCTHHFTSHVRPLDDGRVRRYRICRHCGRRFTTTEIKE
jgi:hypothetical protein